MRLLPSVFRPVPVLTHVLCLVAASALIGCAAKNPLMEEPLASPTPTTKPAPVEPVQSAQNPQTRTAMATPTAPAGVETSRQRRFFGVFSPYRIDIQQGNFISQEMVAQLKIGMTPDQVRFVLGTPLLTDIFHANRWDYVFRLQKGTGQVISSRIAVHFQDNRLASIDAGELPSEQDYLSLIAGSKPAPTAK
jgi:outer membrane protein assembly factor BamE